MTRQLEQHVSERFPVEILLFQPESLLKFTNEKPGWPERSITIFTCLAKIESYTWGNSLRPPPRRTKREFLLASKFDQTLKLSELTGQRQMQSRQNFTEISMIIKWPVIKCIKHPLSPGNSCKGWPLSCPKSDSCCCDSLSFKQKCFFASFPPSSRARLVASHLSY